MTPDPLERAIEHALSPGSFVGWREMGWYIERLEAVKSDLVALVGKGKAAKAVDYLEAFIGACYEKAEEVDDSDAELSNFVEGLFCEWIRARQAARMDAEETVRRFLGWMARDEYGMVDGAALAVVDVLDRSGRAAFERAVRADLEAKRGDIGSHWDIMILKAIYAKKRSVKAYLALCGGEGDLSPADCETVAQMLLARRQRSEALEWVRKGLALRRKGKLWEGGGWELERMERNLLKKLGRPEEALALAWRAYRRHPSIPSYGDLLSCVPRGDRTRWHEKALRELARASLSDRMQVLVHTKESDRLAGVVARADRRSLQMVGFYVAGPAADRLRKKRPTLAAKLHIALGIGILEAKRSRSYDFALGHFQLARQLLLGEKKAKEWNLLVGTIRRRHGRKYGFMPGFERLVASRTIETQPSLLERARRRWENESSNEP